MKITWLGQAGLLFQKNDIRIMIDPYLSDSVKEINPKSFRRVEVNHDLFKIKPDVMIFTHNHLDHYDPETVNKFITSSTSITVLSPVSVWNEVRKIGGNNNFIMFNRHTSWTEYGFRFTAVRAEHSDSAAIGAVLECDGKSYYIAGDTLYNSEILKDLPVEPDVAFLPVNGTGNNMNLTDALRFAKDCGAKKAVPVHYGMFDDIIPHGFDIIPKIYEEITI